MTKCEHKTQGSIPFGYRAFLLQAHAHCEPLPAGVANWHIRRSTPLAAISDQNKAICMLEEPSRKHHAHKTAGRILSNLRSNVIRAYKSVIFVTKRSPGKRSLGKRSPKRVHPQSKAGRHSAFLTASCRARRRREPQASLCPVAPHQPRALAPASRTHRPPQ